MFSKASTEGNTAINVTQVGSFQIVIVIITIRGLLHNTLDGLFYETRLDLNDFPAAFPSNQKMVCRNNRDKAKKKRCCHGAQHGMFLKNAVWFEHRKCTHIDRCSRLLSPSPANREHTQKWLLQVRGVRQKQLFLQLFAHHLLPCLCSFLGSEKDDDGKQKVNRQNQCEK